MNQLVPLSFILFVLFSWLPSADAKMIDCSPEAFDRVFHGTVRAIEGTNVELETNHLWRGKRQNLFTVVDEKNEMKLGRSYVVYAKKSEDGKFHSNACLDKRAMASKYLKVNERTEKNVSNAIRTAVLTRTQKLAESCDAKYLEVLWDIRADGTFGVVRFSPDAHIACGFEKIAWNKKFPKVSDGLPLRATVELNEEVPPVVSFDVSYYLPSHTDKHAEPEALFAAFDSVKRGDLDEVVTIYEDRSDFSGALRHLCRFLGTEAAKAYASKAPNAGFDHDLYRCGLLRRDLKFAEQQVPRKKFGYQWHTEREFIDLVKPMIEAKIPLTVPELVPERIGYAYANSTWGNEPLLLELIADAFARSGDKRTTALIFRRLSLIDNSQDWQNKAEAIYPDVANDWVARDLVGRFAFEAGMQEVRVRKKRLDDLSTGRAFHVVDTAKSIRPKRVAPSVKKEEPPVPEWLILVGVFVVVFLLGSWLIMKKLD